MIDIHGDLDPTLEDLANGYNMFNPNPKRFMSNNLNWDTSDVLPIMECFFECCVKRNQK